MVVDANTHWFTITTIDPQTYTVILVNLRKDSAEKEVIVITGETVRSVDVEDDCDPEFMERVQALFPREQRDVRRNSDAETQKENLLAWFKRNRIPVTEKADGTLNVLEKVEISPPFTADHCFSCSEIVLSRVRNLIQAMPST